MNYFLTTIIMMSVFLLTSCASICEIDPAPVNISNTTVDFSKSKIPCYKSADFQEAVKQVITAVYSDKFKTRLTSYIQNEIGTGPHAAAWQGLNADTVVAQMRQQLNGTYVETYGGPIGLWKNIFFGNLAYDGTKNGPILLNRIPLKKRSVASISNTIAHEIAHRIGLAHPHSDDDFDIALKEPPYVIGKMIEDIIEENIAH